MAALGPFPTKKVLELGAQIADGLAKAHEAGIVHRDLKPENLMVTKDGFVKILDFGLAKLVGGARTEPPGLGGMSTAATEPQRTVPGTVLGTAGYMSPEQASGEPADYRSDQFSFGSILYEMVTGRRAFHRNTAAQTMAAIIQDQPDPIAEVSPKTPAPLCWLVERCLEKEPGLRYASTRDLARDLATLRDHLSGSSRTAVLAAPRPTDRNRVRTAAVVVALLLSWPTAFLAGRREAKRPTPTFRCLTFQRGSLERARFAPDEQTIVYGASWAGGPTELFTSRAESPESRPLGLQGYKLFGISSAGDLAIGQQGAGNHVTLARVALGGGAPRTLLDDVRAADWSPDGTRLAVVRAIDGKSRLELPTGTTIYETRSVISDVRVSPSGRQVAVLEYDSAVNVLIRILDQRGQPLATSPRWRDASGLAWSPDGREIWFSASDVGSVLGLRAMALGGSIHPLLEVPGIVSLLDVSRTGKVLLSVDSFRGQIAGLTPGQTRERDLSWLDGSRIADLSADGQTLLFSEVGAGAGATEAVYLRKSDGAPAVRLGEGTARALSPDGKWAISEPASRVPGSIVLLPTGAGQPRVLEIAPIVEVEDIGTFPDGKSLLVSGTEKGRKVRCYLVDMEKGTPRPITPEGVALGGRGAVSPDGRRLAVLDSRDEHAKEPALALFSVENGELESLKGWREGDTGWQWAADGRALLGHRHDGRTTELLRLEIATGTRQVTRVLAVEERAGVREGPEPVQTPDGAWYAYSYSRLLSTLYLANGLN